MKIYFVTSNKHKFHEFRKFFGPRGIDVEQIDIDIPEIRDEDVAVIAKEKARYAAEKTGKTVVVEDTGLYITALKGFPGSCAKFVFYKIGYEGILKLMDGAKDRSAEFVTAIGYAVPRRNCGASPQSAIPTQKGKVPKIFIGKEKGKIIGEARGDSGFGYDPVFLPDGSAKTYAEMHEEKYATSHRARALEKFAEFLEKL